MERFSASSFRRLRSLRGVGQGGSFFANGDAAAKRTGGSVRVRLRDREYIGDITDIVSLGVASRVDRCIIGKPVPLLFHLFPNKPSLSLSLSLSSIHPIHPMSTTPTSSPSRLLASGSLGAPLHGGESGSFLPDAQSTIPVTPVATSTFVSFEQASTGVSDLQALDQAFTIWTQTGRIEFDAAKTIFGKLERGEIFIDQAIEEAKTHYNPVGMRIQRGELTQLPVGSNVDIVGKSHEGLPNPLASNVDSGQRNLEEVPNLSEVPSGDLSDGISDCESSDSLENDILMGDAFREQGSNALATTSNTTTTVPSEDSTLSSRGSERLQMRKEKVYLDEADRLRKMFRHDLVPAQEKAKLHAAQVASKLKERAQLERNQKLLELARVEVEEDPEIVD